MVNANRIDNEADLEKHVGDRVPMTMAREGGARYEGKIFDPDMKRTVHVFIARGSIIDGLIDVRIIPEGEVKTTLGGAIDFGLSPNSFTVAAYIPYGKDRCVYHLLNNRLKEVWLGDE